MNDSSTPDRSNHAVRHHTIVGQAMVPTRPPSAIGGFSWTSRPVRFSKRYFVTGMLASAVLPAIAAPRRAQAEIFENFPGARSRDWHDGANWKRGNRAHAK